MAVAPACRAMAAVLGAIPRNKWPLLKWEANGGEPVSFFQQPVPVQPLQAFSCFVYGCVVRPHRVQELCSVGATACRAL